MSAITETGIENFIKHQKRRKVKNMTIWHYVKDIRALFYWAMEKNHKFVRINPVVDADLDLIKRRKAVKPPLNLKNFEPHSPCWINMSGRGGWSMNASAFAWTKETGS